MKVHLSLSCLACLICFPPQKDRTFGWSERRKDGQMDGWMDGWVEGKNSADFTIRDVSYVIYISRCISSFLSCTPLVVVICHFLRNPLTHRHDSSSSTSSVDTHSSSHFLARREERKQKRMRYPDYPCRLRIMSDETSALHSCVT